jgi:hypothetical protein
VWTCLCASATSSLFSSTPVVLTSRRLCRHARTTRLVRHSDARCSERRERGAANVERRPEELKRGYGGQGLLRTQCVERTRNILSSLTVMAARSSVEAARGAGGLGGLGLELLLGALATHTVLCSGQCFCWHSDEQYATARHRPHRLREVACAPQPSHCFLEFGSRLLGCISPCTCLNTHQ